VGDSVVGESVGDEVVGKSVGELVVGDADACAVGLMVGAVVGSLDTLIVGAAVTSGDVTVALQKDAAALSARNAFASQLFGMHRGARIIVRLGKPATNSHVWSSVAAIKLPPADKQVLIISVRPATL